MCSYLCLSCGCLFADSLSRCRAAYPNTTPNYCRWVTCGLRHRESVATGPKISCKLPGFRATRHAICTARLAEKAHVQAFDIHNTLNGKVPVEEDPAAQFQLTPSTWNASIRQAS